MNDEIVVRRAQRGDLARVAQLAGALVRMHHDVDPSRFLLVENVEDGYARWFERQLASDEAVILVASRGPTLVGYAYGTLEDRNWNLCWTSTAPCTMCSSSPRHAARGPDAS